MSNKLQPIRFADLVMELVKSKDKRTKILGSCCLEKYSKTSNQNDLSIKNFNQFSIHKRKKIDLVWHHSQ